MKPYLAISMFLFVLLGGYRPKEHSGEQERVLQLLHKKAPNVIWGGASLLRGNFNPDDKIDYALLGQEGKNRVFVGVVYSPLEPKGQVDILEFGVGQDQGSLCRLPAQLKLESLDYGPSDEVGKISGFRRSSKVMGLNLADGDCDSFHLFWNYQSHHIDWWRL
ncbi:MAG: hypothetical protein EPN47_20240 [Acidobacteria bacterium]|nr:MAG: hypothetical protein EPN47_20240 [Acidobacteriota bacterium]